MIVLFSGCIPKSEYKTQPSGLLFKLLTIAEEEKRIMPGNYVQFKISRIKSFDNSDSVNVLDEKRLFLFVPERVQMGGVMEALSLINEKELGQFRTKSIFIESEIRQITKWNAFNADSLVSFQLLIDKIYTSEEYQERKTEFISWISKTEIDNAIFNTEMQLINQFIKKNNLSFATTKSGLKYKFLSKKETENTLKYGDHVFIKYKGSFLNGSQVINSFDNNELLDFFVGQELQVIKGLEEALLLMKRGEKIALIIPSWLAFGKKGSSNGLIPPNTPVYYEMEVVTNP